MYLNPTVEYQHLSEWLSTLVGERITPRSFVKRLGKHLNKHQHPIRVKLYTGDKSSLKPGEFTIGAEYDPGLDEIKKKQFIIDFILNHPKTVPITISADMADQLAMDLLETLIHEYEHQRQFRNRRYRYHRNVYRSDHRDPDKRADQEYLGDPDEIDAYAQNIAARHYLMKYKLNITSVAKINSPDLKQYYKAFGKDHEVTKLLLKKVRANVKYYKENDNGKNHRRAFKRPQFKRR
jgi:hypothetical protein